MSSVPHETAPYPQLMVQMDLTSPTPFAAPTTGPTWPSPVAASTPVWTDITTYVRGTISIRSGRGNELDRVDSSSLTLSLDNSDRRFEPEYAASPYYPNVVPMRPIRVQAVYGQTLYNLFTGYINPQLTWPDYRRGLLNVTANDAFMLFGIDEVTMTLAAGQSGTQLFTLLTQLDRYEPLVQAGAPVHYWRLGNADNVTPGTLWDDVPGPSGGIVGTYTGGVTYGQPGPVASGISPSSVLFNGTSGQVIIPTAANIDAIAASWTVEAWVYPTATRAATTSIIAREFAASNVPFALNYGAGTVTNQLGTNPTAGRVWGGFFDNASSTWYAVVDPTDAPLSTWTHYAVTWDGNYLRMYRNGVEVANYDPPRVPIASTGLRTFVATAAASGGPWFAGRIAEVAVYNYALTQQQEQAHYQVASLGVPFPRTYLLLLDPGEESLLGAAPTPGSPSGLLDMMQTVADSEGGIFFMDGGGHPVFHSRDHRVTSARSTVSQATFGDGAPASGELPYVDLTPDFDVQRIENLVEVTSGLSGALPQQVQDFTSRTNYGTRRASRSTQLASDERASQQAQRILLENKDPHLRIPQLSVEGTRDSRLWPVVLGLAMSDRATVIRRPYSGGAAINKALYIEGVNHDIDYAHDVGTARSWKTTYALSLADKTTYWHLDDSVYSVLDSTTILR